MSAAAFPEGSARCALLLIDIGNTRLKWAWCETMADVTMRVGGTAPTPWQQLGAVPHAGLGQLASEWAALLTGLQSGLPATAGEPRPAIWISNVAGAAVAATVGGLLVAVFGAGVPLHWVRSAVRHGDVENGYRDPRQLGVDRWVGSIGAHAHWPQDNLLIVTAGTATTLDIVTVRGTHARFDGGLILPGLDLMRGALARNTAQLPEVSAEGAGAVLAHGWADNTRDAIAAGCLAAQAGAIERTWRTLAAMGPVRCLFSGGARHVLATAFPPDTAMAFELHDNLVLLGLHVMATRGGGWQEAAS